MEKKVSKIVITGGPCAGKSTGLSWVEQHLTKFGCKVFVVAETATEVITGGAGPWLFGDKVAFQAALMALQQSKENFFMQAAQLIQDQKVVIVCDRGQLDSQAYMTKEEFAQAAKIIGKSRTLLRDDYDAVFHLVTAADGAQEFYTLANNAARTETVEQAVVLDRLVLEAWVGHPHLRTIDNKTDFEGKMRRLLEEISHFLGEPTPREIERKYKIAYPDLLKLDGETGCRKVEILQTYLLSVPGQEVRLRQCGSAQDGYVYTQTIKRRVSALTRQETEKRLTRKEYTNLLLQADPNRRPIRKDRRRLMYHGTYYEIDTYLNWNEWAIMEVELKDETELVPALPFIKIIKEVTGDKNYDNFHLASTGFDGLTD